MVDGMTRSPTTRLLHETVHFLLGLIALTVLTASCFWRDVGLVSTAFTYLILILLLSLAGGFIPLIALSFIAVASLNSVQQVAADARHQHADRMGLEDAQRGTRHPDLAQHHHAGQ